MPAHISLPDSSLIELSDDGHQWSICWPDGSHSRGQAPDQATGRAAALAVHDHFVLEQWPKGHLKAPGWYEVPIR